MSEQEAKPVEAQEEEFSEQEDASFERPVSEEAPVGPARSRSKTLRVWNGSTKKRPLPVLDDEGNVIDTENMYRPTSRAECAEGHRPCPFVGCKYHLYLDVTRTGNIKLNFPDREPWELEQSCALDVADKGNTTLKVVGELMNLTRERARQLEKTILVKVQRAIRIKGIG